MCLALVGREIFLTPNPQRHVGWMQLSVYQASCLSESQPSCPPTALSAYQVTAKTMALIVKARPGLHMCTVWVSGATVQYVLKLYFRFV